VERIGTNRRLLDKNVIFDFVKPFDLIPEFKAKIGKIDERSPASAGLNEPAKTASKNLKVSSGRNY
jgi:uncharacterized membrane protein YkvA (DUF1232 family)